IWVRPLPLDCAAGRDPRALNGAERNHALDRIPVRQEDHLRSSLHINGLPGLGIVFVEHCPACKELVADGKVMLPLGRHEYRVCIDDNAETMDEDAMLCFDRV